MIISRRGNLPRLLFLSARELVAGFGMLGEFL